jgi:hypothetical protein
MTSTLEELARQDTIDSRELLDRLDELDGATPEDDEEAVEFAAELAELRALQAETEGYAGDNWRDGVTFIAESFFEEYAEELAADIGAIDRNASWPLNRIDWTAAADDLKDDYTSAEINGAEYWYR